MKAFHCASYGKWILCGEHAVLRNHSALVFPIYSKKLNFHYKPEDKPLNVRGEGGFSEHYRFLFLSIYHKALDMLNIKSLRGEIHLSGNLPVGSGLGASASVSVILGKWFKFLGFIKTEELFSFCKGLEDVFHGESSGADIAVNLEEKPICFTKTSSQPIIHPLRLKWNPYWLLSFSGEMGFTADCVRKVKDLFKTDPQHARKLDLTMKEAVEEASKAICVLDQKEGLYVLKEAVDKAYACFKGWGLITDHLESYMESLREKNCLALKPTGAGEGGYVLSLWNSYPTLQKSFIKI